MIDLKYRDIVKQNTIFEFSDDVQKCEIAILSNIMVHQSKDICEYSLKSENLNATVSLYEYDNIVQESFNIAKHTNTVIIFLELCNYFDGLEYKIENFSDSEYTKLVSQIKSEIDLILKNLHNIPHIIFNKFSSLVFSRFTLECNKFQELQRELNHYLSMQKQKNIIFVDIDKIISELSISKAIDFRYYESSKTLYKVDFFKEYFEWITPLFLSSMGKVKKALIFDCDNTLWKGILGEDGKSNIIMFHKIQMMAISLAKRGVIIGLCSKNNYDDIEDILQNHDQMKLTNEYIVIKKINWNDKASNLREMSEELNIGLDSFVFVDDSEFEINLVNNKLPMIKTFQVPTTEYDFFHLMKKITSFFYVPTRTSEDYNKIQMYKSQVSRIEEKNNSNSIEDYLKSLELKLVVHTNKVEQIDRISQMSQKTNQFNLTTKRYSENDIFILLKSENKIVLTIEVIDKFGNSGISGLAIIELEDNYAIIDTFLMSCRILGRNIEYKFMDFIVDYLKSYGINYIDATYKKTIKNQQVEELFERFNYTLIQNNNANKQYTVKVDEYVVSNINYIEVIDG